MGSGLIVLVCWLFRWNVSHAVTAASRIHSNQALIRYGLVLTQTGSSTELSSELVALSSIHKAEGSHTSHLLLYKHDSAAFSTTHTHTQCTSKQSNFFKKHCKTLFWYSVPVNDSDNFNLFIYFLNTFSLTIAWIINYISGESQHLIFYKLN